MKKTIVTLICSLAAFSHIFAVNITGYILSQEGSTPIAGASVALLRQDSTIVMQTQSEANGRFSLSATASAEGNLISVSFVGYDSRLISVIPGESQSLNLGNILLAESASTRLGEVTVSANKIAHKVDKYIVIPQKDDVERSSRAIDLLEQIPLPGLSVDRALKSITINNGTPVLMVNGKERDLNYFSNMNPDKILRIEYNNTPGIRYIERGASGIINFILKEPEEGGSITAQLSSAFTTGFINGYLNGTYNYKKSQFSLLYNCGYRDYDKWLANNNEKFIGDDKRYIERNQSGINSPMYYFDNTIAADYTYMHDANTMLVVNFSNNICPTSGGNDGHITEIKDGTVWEYDRVQRRKGNNYNPTLDMFFSKKLNHGQSIELNAVGNISHGYAKRDLWYYYGNDIDNDMIYYETDNDGWSIAAEAAYGKDFKSVATRFGVQYLHNYAENEYKAGGSLSKMKKDNTYAYGEIGGKLGNMGYNVGTGVKILYVNDFSDSRTFVRNLTTATLQLPVGKKWNLRYNFGYSPSLPSLSQLSPILSQTDDITYSTGNPKLKPSELISNKISADFQTGNFTANITGGYNHRFNPINSTTSYVVDKDYFVYTCENGKYYFNAYIGSQLSYKKLFNHINIHVKAYYNRYQTKGTEYKYHLNNFSGDIRLQAFFGDWTLGAGQSFATKKYLSGTTIGSYENSSYAYVQYKYRNFFFNAMVLCPFQKDGYKYERESLSAVNPGYYVNWTKNNGNMITLSVAYQANFGKSFKKNRKTLNNGSYDNGMVQ